MRTLIQIRSFQPDFLTRQTTDGIGECLFADWRFDKSGKLNEDFILNQPESTKCRNFSNWK